MKIQCIRGRGIDLELPINFNQTVAHSTKNLLLNYYIFHEFTFYTYYILQCLSFICNKYRITRRGTYYRTEFFRKTRGNRCKAAIILQERSWGENLQACSLIRKFQETNSKPIKKKKRRTCPGKKNRKKSNRYQSRWESRSSRRHASREADPDSTDAETEAEYMFPRCNGEVE